LSFLDPSYDAIKALFTSNVFSRAASEKGAYYEHGRRKEGGLAPWILKISAKNVNFLISSGKNISPLLAPPWKIF